MAGEACRCEAVLVEGVRGVTDLEAGLRESLEGVVVVGGPPPRDEEEARSRGEGVTSTSVCASRALTMVSNWKRVSLTSFSRGVELLLLDWTDILRRLLSGAF